MNKAGVRRVTLLMGTLAAVAAITLPPGDSGGAVQEHRPSVPRAGERVPLTTVAAVAVDVPPVVPEMSDPFAPRGWQAPPIAIQAPPTLAPAPEAPPVPLPVEPVGPPPVPYTFMGQMEDAGRTVVYLSRGDQTLLARPGVTLDSVYKVLAMDARHIEFEHLPTGVKQVLSIPASQ